jgi:hypothetical protein
MAGLISSIIEATIPELTTGIGIALPYLKSLTLQGTPLSGIAREAWSTGAVGEQLPRLSANEIIRRTRSLGFGVNRKKALKAIKAMKAQVDAFIYISKLSKGRRPLASKVPLTDQRQRLKYQYTVQLVGTSLKTGEPYTQYIRINQPRLISKNQAIDLAIPYAELGTSGDEMTVDKADVPIITRQNPNIVNF